MLKQAKRMNNDENFMTKQIIVNRKGKGAETKKEDILSSSLVILEY